MKTMIAALVATVSLSAAVMAQEPAFDRARDNTPVLDFSGVQSELAGGATEVLVLGTPHLNGMRDEIPLADLALLLNRLEAFALDLIAIESAALFNCDIVRRYAEIYEGVADRYCTDPTPALAGLDLDPVAARIALYETLRNLPDTLEPAQRRRLAALFYATDDANSAALQWMHLAPDERVEGDGVNADLVQRLNQRLGSHNETVSIAAVLGERLGHQRLHPMDDRMSQIAYVFSGEALSPTLREMWQQDSVGMGPIRQALAETLGSPEAVLAYYRELNSAAFQRGTVDSDFGPAAQNTANDNITRHYLAWWQARGLHMAGNVMSAAAAEPGARILVIVGASHKSYFEAYLDQMHDIELVDLDTVLHD